MLMDFLSYLSVGPMQASSLACVLARSMSACLSPPRDVSLTLHEARTVMNRDCNVTQIDHCSVIITDVERSRGFYRDVLHLQEINKPRTFDFVVVVSARRHAVAPAAENRPDTLSPRHFALRVTDCWPRGVLSKFSIATQRRRPFPRGSVLVADPDGNRIEISSGANTTRQRMPLPLRFRLVPALRQRHEAGDQ